MSVFYGFAISDRDPSGGSPRPGCLSRLSWKHPRGRLPQDRPSRTFLVSRIGARGGTIPSLPWPRNPPPRDRTGKMSGIVGVIASDYQRGRPGAQFWPGAVDTVIN